MTPDEKQAARLVAELALREQLHPGTFAKLRWFMTWEPWPVNEVDDEIAKFLERAGLIEADEQHRWVVCWEQVRSGTILPKAFSS